MRIRSTKPEFWKSKTIATLSWDARLVLKGLESYVDDNGVGKDDLALIAADLFPRDLSARAPETLARLSEAISELSEGGLIVRYERDDDDLLYVDRWKEKQRVDKPNKGRYPRPDGTYEYEEVVNRESYQNPRETLANTPEVLAPVTGEQGNRGTDLSPASADAERVPDGFDDFWAAYPRKKDKGHGVKAYRQALKRAKLPDILEALERDKRTTWANRQAEHIPYPATWLNGNPWDDEPDQSPAADLYPENGTPAEQDAWLARHPAPARSW